MTLLKVTGITKAFNNRRQGGRRSKSVLSDVSFTLEQGRTMAVVGESGAGKSTLARAIVRLVEPDAGSVRLNGRELVGLGRRDLVQARRPVQFVFQDPFGSLDPRRTIGESVGEPIAIQLGTNRPDRERRVASLLSTVGLDPSMATRRPRELSGGQLQRVAIARALSTDPKLIVCDEAVASLDVSVRAQILNLLAGMQQELGVSYLFISHELQIVSWFSDTVAIMKDGRIVEQGETGIVFGRPQHEYTRALLDARPGLATTLPRTADPDPLSGRDRHQPRSQPSLTNLVDQIARRSHG